MSENISNPHLTKVIRGESRERKREKGGGGALLSNFVKRQKRHACERF